MIPGPVRWTVLAALASLAVVRPNVAAAQVAASIEIPEAETYVLGDDIPLIWEFNNLSARPVAMLWEGCCRLNGRLDISANGNPITVLPPGAASFHSYTKAEELTPNTPAKFASLLSDWVQIPRGGYYDIGGRYTGVLPSQTPQVEDGLDLWRGTAIASPASLALLSVDDYLNQRKERTADRGWSISLSGRQALPPLDPIEIDLEIANVSSERRSFDWPGTIEIWLVNEDGIRLPQATRRIRQSGESIDLAPGESFVRKVELSSTDLGGSEFGDYTLFVDLAASESEGKRVPSNALNLTWTLEDQQLVTLLNDAAAGPSIGMRNPTLKLLRVYLDQLGQRLGDLDEKALNVKAQKLRHELRMAACLKPLSPKPGRVVLPMEVNQNGVARLDLPAETFCESFVASNGPKQVTTAYEIRRHLGWDIGVEFRGHGDTPLHQFFKLMEEMNSSGVKLSGPAFHSLPSETGGTNVVQFVPQPVACNLLFRIKPNGLAVAARKAQPGRPAWMNTFRASELTNVSVEPIEPSRLTDWVAKQEITSPRILIIADESIRWSDLQHRLLPIWEIASRLSVIPSQSEQN